MAIARWSVVGGGNGAQVSSTRVVIAVIVFDGNVFFGRLRP